MLEDLLNELGISATSYDLSSDFAEITNTLNNNLVELKLLQRPGSYQKALVAGSYFPKITDIGVVFFISKSSYPVFLPLNFGIENLVPTKPGEITITSKKSGTSHVGGDAKNFKQLDRTYQYFGLRTNSSPKEQYVLSTTEADLKSIAYQWYYSKVNIDKSKFVPGDCSIKANVPFAPHKGHAGGNKVDCYTTLDETNVASKFYSITKTKELLRICFDNLAYLVGFYDAKNQSDLVSLFPKIASWKDHTNHFHVEFNVGDAIQMKAL